jgi:hypothetical protein
VSPRPPPDRPRRSAQPRSAPCAHGHRVDPGSRAATDHRPPQPTRQPVVSGGRPSTRGVRGGARNRVARRDRVGRPASPRGDTARRFLRQLASDRTGADAALQRPRHRGGRRRDRGRCRRRPAPGDLRVGRDRPRPRVPGRAERAAVRTVPGRLPATARDFSEPACDPRAGSPPRTPAAARAPWRPVRSLPCGCARFRAEGPGTAADRPRSPLYAGTGPGCGRVRPRRRTAPRAPGSPGPRPRNGRRVHRYRGRRSAVPAVPET